MPSYHFISASLTEDEIVAELKRSLDRLTLSKWSRGMTPNVKFIDRLFSNQIEATEYLTAGENRFYANVAVKFKRPIPNHTSEKLKQLKSSHRAAVKELRDFDGIVFAKRSKSNLATCRHCGSKINKAYINSNHCPLCDADMRSATVLKKLAALESKTEALRKKIDAEQQRLTDEKWETMWVIKIEH